MEGRADWHHATAVGKSRETECRFGGSEEGLEVWSVGGGISAREESRLGQSEREVRGEKVGHRARRDIGPLTLSSWFHALKHCFSSECTS